MTAELSTLSRSALRVALSRQEVTRKELSSELGVSFPSITAALSELARNGLVEELRREQGARGRATLVYGVSANAGWVLGLDIGSTQVTCLGSRLNGTELFRETAVVTRDVEIAGPVAAGMIREALERHGMPRSIAFAVNQIVTHTPHLPGPHGRRRAARVVELAIGSLDLPPTLPIAVENNVNCSAVAEHELGALKTIANGAYLQVGVGLGYAFLVEDALVRGGSGSVGEIAGVPMSWDPDVPSPRDAIEIRYGSVGLLAQATELMGDDAPRTPEELFAMADAGDERAAELRARHAAAVGRIASGVTTITDPTILVVGGGLTRDAVFVEEMRREFNARMPHIDMRTSLTGDSATVLGAMLLAHDLALAELIGPAHRRLVPRPALWAPEKATTE